MQCRPAIQTLGAALAVFCALVGIGSWLVGSPAPSWFPWRGPWIGGLLITSIALGVALRGEIWARRRVSGAEGAPR